MENEVCYRILSLGEYRGLLKTIAENREQELQVLFDPLIEKFGSNNWCLILVGSDGKQERHPQSKTELVLFCKDGKPRDEMKKTIKYLIPLSTDPIEFEEIKTLDDKESPLSFYNGQSDRCYPDRILNSNFLLGDDDVFIQARRQVLLEMSKQSKLGKKIREKLRTQLWDYKKALTSGQYRGQIIFDEKNQYYFEANDWKNARMGFKMGPLRAVQRKLDFLTLAAIRQGQLKLMRWLKIVPQTLVNELNFLLQKGSSMKTKEK